jgi:hypothetical protein
MKVLDLQCRQGHRFEGWFGSQADYDAQRDRGLVTCPVCNDSEITKMLSAPRPRQCQELQQQTLAAPQAARLAVRLTKLPQHRLCLMLRPKPCSRCKRP